MTDQSKQNLQPILQVKDLSVSFNNGVEVTRAVKQTSFNLYPGKTLALVGESGSGKSVSALSALQLHPKSSVQYQGEILFEGQNIQKLEEDFGRFDERWDDLARHLQTVMKDVEKLNISQKKINDRFRKIVHLD